MDVEERGIGLETRIGGRTGSGGRKTVGVVGGETASIVGGNV